MSLKTRSMLVVSAVVFAGVRGLTMRMVMVAHSALKKTAAESLATVLSYISSQIDPEFELCIDALRAISAASGVGVLAAPVLIQDNEFFGVLEHTRLGKAGYSNVASPKDHAIVWAADRLPRSRHARMYLRFH